MRHLAAGAQDLHRRRVLTCGPRAKLNVTRGPKFSWNKFFDRMYGRVFRADVFSHSANAAFYFCFALFPLLYFLISVFALILGSSQTLRGELSLYLAQIMPWSVYQLVETTIDEIVTTATGGKLTLGLLVTLWFASAGVDGIRVGLNAVYSREETRPYWRTKLQSIGLTFVGSLLIGIVLAMVFYGWQMFGYLLGSLGVESPPPWLLVMIQWITILIVMFAACEIIYNFLPDFKRFRWIRVTPGSVVAVGLWLVLTTGFRIYLSYFNTYNRTYGSLGAMMILMLWLYLTALTILVGGAINAVLEEMRRRIGGEENAA